MAVLQILSTEPRGWLLAEALGFATQEQRSGLRRSVKSHYLRCIRDFPRIGVTYHNSTYVSRECELVIRDSVAHIRVLLGIIEDLPRALLLQRMEAEPDAFAQAAVSGGRFAADRILFGARVAVLRTWADHLFSSGRYGLSLWFEKEGVKHATD